MGGYFDRGASAGGREEGYFNRENITGEAGTGSATGGPGGVVSKDDIEFDAENPNLARAVPSGEGATDETAGVTTQAGFDGAIVEGSDSERTGTDWGLAGRHSGEMVATPEGDMPEGEGEGMAHPNRNTGGVVDRESLNDRGAWGTMSTGNSAGSPTGNS